MKFFKLSFIVCLILLATSENIAQISINGTPPSYSESSLKQQIPAKNLYAVRVENRNFGKIVSGQDISPREIGYMMPANIDFEQDGVWDRLKNGRKIWRIKINSNGAEALAVYFKEFKLPESAELYIYKPDYSQILGAYTSANNHSSGLFATQLIEGESCIIEYVVKAGNNDLPFILDEVAYVYRDSGFNNNLKGFGTSGNCEINVNCEEGDDWQDQKRGVARIQVKEGGSLFWCSGSLINNANQDQSPFFLTANHCGDGSSTADYNQWIFYFNYESDDCNDPVSEPIANTMLGASYLASTNFATHSDFKLLLLNSDVPGEFNPFYNGWDINNVASTSGVTIHHPDGDIKKISTFTETAMSTSYDQDVENPSGKYWRVVWSTTTNGQGVTEGGSSGAPLFNQNGLLVGALTGGRASCSNQDAPDFYGKFSYSWESGGTGTSEQLKAWLDPNNTGITTVGGINAGADPFEAIFKASDTTAVPVENSLNFTDLSIGTPTAWQWTFEGGTPASSTQQNPSGIVYNEIGFYDVKLVVSRGTRIDSVRLENYVKVQPRVGPNPARDDVTIYLGVSPQTNVELTLFDESGKTIQQYVEAGPLNTVRFNVSRFNAGYYFLRIKTSSYVEVHKLAIF